MGAEGDAALSERARTRLGGLGWERAVGLLKRAFAKGELSAEELDERVAWAYAAKIRNDLRPVLEDLPEYQAVRRDRRLTRFWLD